MASASLPPKIILDLSRLLSRVLFPTPTGVDRCEMAYARGLLAAVPDRLRFAAAHPWGAYGRLSRDAVLRFLDATEERWDHRGFASRLETRRFALSALIALRPRAYRRDRHGPRPLYLLASPSNLTRPNLVAAILRQEKARLLCLVHDLIPLQFPEYAREGGARDHEVRVRTILTHADGVVCNSAATLDALRPWMERLGRHPRAAVAHLGVRSYDRGDPVAPQDFAGGAPYFVCIGTIEPRKNHLLLLHLWRQMSERFGPANIPKLFIVGRRGWENEQIVDMLERCTALKGCVEERNSWADDKVAALLAGARALLLPSFAEGYGMPVTEALSLNVPVICSDLAALREAGGPVPEFLDPLDGPAWLQAIQDYATGHSTRRQNQLDRLASWTAPDWDSHLRTVLDLGQEIS